MSKILIVEDEPNMQKGLKDNLEFEGYEADVAGDGETGLDLILKNDYHLILLDVMLPKLSGFDICKQVRKKGIKTPIILLTAKGEEIDKVLGLELGADDYITKPFSLRELLARIKAVLRRSPDPTANTDSTTYVNIGKLTINFDNYEAFDGKESQKMTAKELDLLRYLWKHKNTIVSRDDILENIWGYDYQPSTRTIDNFIVKLRQKIEENPNQPKIILSLYGLGYKLVD
ncbi:MAG: response regulator transcription factor [Bacteroidales bacterium]|nr:response regulator transcription factor [Bacteroidales bacterium]